MTPLTPGLNQPDSIQLEAAKPVHTLRSSESSPSSDTCTGERRSRKVYPLSPSLERLIIERDFKDTAERPPPAIMCRCLKLEGPLNISALRDAIHAILKRHSALRIQISPNPEVSDVERTSRIAQSVRQGILISGLYVQRVGDVQEVPLQMYDAAFGDLERVVQTIVKREVTTPFEYDVPSRLRISLVSQTETTHVLVLAVDHWVSDGRSLKILQTELQRWYSHFACGSLPPLPPIGSYLQFIEQQQLLCASSGFDADLDYWEDHWRQFSGARLRPIDIPFADLSARRSRTFSKQTLNISEDDTVAFRSAAKRARVTPYVFFLSVFVAVLHLYTRRDHIALWTHCANRNREQLNTIGFYINSHLMGFRLSSNITGRELMVQVANRHRETIRHERMPLPLLWQSLHCSPRFGDSGVILVSIT